MQNRKKYIVAIIFLASGLFLILGIFYWFDIYARKDINKYQIVFHESVDGLANHSVVRYNGVTVGYVTDIALDKKSFNSINVVVSIDKDVPIFDSTQATLKAQGITGLYYIGLTNLGDIKTAKPLIAKGNDIPTINSTRSLSDLIVDNTQSITSNVAIISKQATRILTDQNLKNLQDVLDNMAAVSKKLVKTTDAVSISLKNFDNLSISLQNSANHFDSMTINAKQLLDELSVTNSNTNSMVKNFNKNTLSKFNDYLIPNINNSIVNFNKNMLELNKTITMLNNNPSVLVKGMPVESYGPGE